MPPIKGQMLKYSQEQMENAIGDVLRGVPVATAARTHNVPRITLLYKVKGKSPRERRMGPVSYITTNEEKILVQWIIRMAKAGFPVGKEELYDSVQHLVTKLNRAVPFKDNRPGKTWYKSFLKRNPEVSLRTPQNLTTSRAAVTEEHITSWHAEVKTYLQEIKQESTLKDPTRVFNADETAFFLNPQGNKILAAKGDKTVYQQVNSNEKECLTVMIAGNAAGNLVPPMIVFKYDRIPQEVAKSIPLDWGIGKSPSGWMCGDTFFNYITEIFHRWLISKSITLPVILFIDGHSSHLTLHTSKFCEENGIILISLYPNATHLIQPMDVSIFRSLKGGWRNIVHEWRLENMDKSPILRKPDFAPLLKKVLDSRITAEMFKNGFSKSGLVPWDSTAPFKNKQISDIKRGKTENQLRVLENGLHFVGKYIDREKVRLFRTTDLEAWEGDDRDVSLFKFYKHIWREQANLKKTLKGVQGEKNQHLQEQEQETILSTSVLDNEVPSTSQLYNHVTPSSSPTINPSPTQNSRNEGQDELVPSPSQFNNHVTPSSSPTINPSPTQNSRNEGQDELVPSPFKGILRWPDERKPNPKRRRREHIPPVATSKQWQLYYEKKERAKKEQEENKKKRAEDRQKKKEIQEKIKLAKKQERENNRIKNGKRKKNVVLSESESEEDKWVESGDSLDDLSPEGEPEGQSTDSEGKPEGQSPKCSNQDSQDLYVSKSKNIREGNFILAVFPGKKKEHNYVCVIRTLLSDNEVEVVGLKCCNDAKTQFTLNDSDVSTIQSAQIKTILELPKIVVSGERLKYEFNSPQEVDG